MSLGYRVFNCKKIKKIPRTPKNVIHVGFVATPDYSGVGGVGTPSL